MSTTNIKSSIRSLYTWIVDQLATKQDADSIQTFTNKTITTPVIASIYQDEGKTKLMTLPNTTSDTLCGIAATQTLTNKTLTTPVVASIYQDAGKTKLMTLPNTASDTLVALAATQTLTNKTLTAPEIVEGVLASVTTGAGDVTLSATEAKVGIIEVSTGHASNAIIAPATLGKTYWIVNNSIADALIKKAAGTPVTVATTKKALVYYNGTNYVRLTADQ